MLSDMEEFPMQITKGYLKVQLCSKYPFTFIHKGFSFSINDISVSSVISFISFILIIFDISYAVSDLFEIFNDKDTLVLTFAIILSLITLLLSFNNFINKFSFLLNVFLKCSLKFHSKTTHFNAKLTLLHLNTVDELRALFQLNVVEN